MSEREDFEAVYKRVFPGHMLDRSASDGRYVNIVAQGAWQVWQARAQHGADLTQLAKSKIDQMGGTICGVLVRNEAGALAAVSDLGRVIWLDDAGTDSGAISEREEFEKKFPVPTGVFWSETAKDYDCGSPLFREAKDSYSKMWQAWKAARAQQSADSGEAVAWLNADDPKDAISDIKKHSMERSLGIGAAQLAEKYSIPLVRADTKPTANQVPDAKTARDFYESGDFLLAQDLHACEQQAEGWNKCRASMLSTKPDAGAGQCEWHLADEDHGIWQAPCGACWSFIDGGPTENKVNFCPHCSKPLIVAQPPQGEE